MRYYRVATYTYTYLPMILLRYRLPLRGYRLVRKIMKTNILLLLYNTYMIYIF